MAKGIRVHDDVLVNKTADGVDLNAVSAEVQTVLELWNNERKSITDLPSFKTVNVADVVPQSSTTDSFEEATEFGIPRAIRPPSDYDPTTAFTWKFLRDATAEQIQANVARALEADNKLTTNSVMNRILTRRPVRTIWEIRCTGCGMPTACRRLRFWKTNSMEPMCISS
jgi:hypothetical protein